MPNHRNGLQIPRLCATALMLGWCAALVAAEKEHVLTVPLEEPQIERISSTQYRVTCDTGRKETIVLKGAPESSSAGPKNQYILQRARQLCWQSTRQRK